MKKLVSLFLLVLAACATAPLPAHRDDSNTANQIPTSNALMVPQMQTFMGAEAANRNQEQGLANFVDNFSPNSIAGACLGTTGAGLTMNLGACIAYNAGYRSTCGVGNNLGLGPGGTLPTSTTADCPGGNSITFANTKTTWVAMDENTTGNNLGLANFTRVTGTQYLTDAIDSSQPAMAPDSQLLMKVTTAGGSITAVQDLRNVHAVSTVPSTGVYPQTYGAVGNCTNPATGSGCTDDCPAFQAAVAAMCPYSSTLSADACAQSLIVPPGTYYWPTGCQLNPSTINNASTPNYIGRLRIEGSGAAGSGFAQTTILCGQGAGEACLDLFGNAGADVENIDFKTTTTNTATKAMIAGGKTKTCDCDVPTFRNVSIEDYSTAAIAGIFLLGWEDATIATSEIYMFNGGHPVVFSGTNVVGGGLTSGVTLDVPNTSNAISNAHPVSMTASYVNNSVLATNVALPAGLPASACAYLDSPTSGTAIANDGLINTYCQLNGLNDRTVWDGATGKRGGTISGFRIDGGAADFLNTAGAGVAQEANIGELATNWHIATSDNSAGVMYQTGTDGATNSNTTFTTTTGTCLVGGQSIIGSAIYVAGAAGTIPGAYVTNCTGSSPATITLSSNAQGTATGLTWYITLTQLSFPTGLTNSYVNLSDAYASLLCGNGVGTQVSGLSQSYQQIPYCPGTLQLLPSSATAVISQPINTGVGLVLRPFQDYGSPGGDVLQCTNAAGTVVTCSIDPQGDLTMAGSIGATGSVAGAFLQQSSKAFASCPALTDHSTGACSAAGVQCAITDDNTACAFGATIVDGGSHKVLGYCDGTQYVMTECK